MRNFPRRATPKVWDGKVQRKNRAAATPNYYNTPQGQPAIDRLGPGDGFRHVLMERHVREFISILPDWPELSRGLRAVLLAPREPGWDGYHTPGVVALCVWERRLWRTFREQYLAEHRDLFDRLGVPVERVKQGWECRFTEETARAYQLLHILLHELGHHHDRMTTRSQANAARGEGYAEHYAVEYADPIWDRYFQRFGY